MRQSDRFTGNSHWSGGRCGGAPGIYSARYSGEDATDQKNLQKLLETLKDVPDDQRQARFHCVLVYLPSRGRSDPAGVPWQLAGCDYWRTGGHWWLLVMIQSFFVPSEGKTAAELTREERAPFPPWSGVETAAGRFT